MISYIQGTKSEGHQCFTGSIPSILQLQNMIEHAWDMGFNIMGRVETGGIRGTRKYIGTPEVSFLALQVKGRPDRPRPKHCLTASGLGTFAVISLWRELMLRLDVKQMLSPTQGCHPSMSRNQQYTITFLTQWSSITFKARPTCRGKFVGLLYHQSISSIGVSTFSYSSDALPKCGQVIL